MNFSWTVFGLGIILSFIGFASQPVIAQVSNSDSQQIDSKKVPADSKETNDSKDSQTPDESAADDLSDSADEDGEIADSDVYDQPSDDYATSPMSIEIQTGRIWIKDGDFDADFIDFSPSWYVFEDLPIKMGPVIRHEKFINLDPSIKNGQILDIRLQLLGFWDFGFFTPYMAVEASLFSLGTMLIDRTTEDSVKESGSIRLNSQAYELSLGSQFRVTNQLYLTAEWTALARRHISRDGTLGKTSGSSKTVTKYQKSDNFHYMSASVGIMFEL